MNRSLWFTSLCSVHSTLKDCQIHFFWSSKSTDVHLLFNHATVPTVFPLKLNLNYVKVTGIISPLHFFVIIPSTVGMTLLYLTSS